MSFLSAVVGRLRPRRRDDRGDVPGWVLITLMTAAIVGVLWGVAGPQLSSIFSNAVCNVSGQGGAAQCAGGSAPAGGK